MSAIQSATQQPVLLASTGPSGFALQNATPTILSWTAPNDGQLHRVSAFFQLVVATGETGGAMRLNSMTSGFVTLDAGGHVAGSYATAANPAAVVVQPGFTVTVTQSSVLSAGAATAYIELWGS